MTCIAMRVCVVTCIAMIYKMISPDCIVVLQAYEDRTRANVPKPIERRKLEPKIKDFVRDSIRRLLENRR